MYKFYVKMDGETYGPYSAKEVRDLQLMDDILVTEESMNEWLPAGRFDFNDIAKKELYERLSQRRTQNKDEGNVGVGKDFKINEYGEIIRDNELLTLEQNYLEGIPLDIKHRKLLASQSQNTRVLEQCLKDKNILVRRAVWDNPYLPPELRKEANRQRLIDRGPKKPRNTTTPTAPTTPNSNEKAYQPAQAGCLGEMILNIVLILGIILVIWGIIQNAQGNKAIPSGLIVMGGVGIIGILKQKGIL